MIIKIIMARVKWWRIKRMPPRKYCFHLLKKMPTEELVKMIYEHKGLNKWNLK